MESANCCIQVVLGVSSVQAAEFAWEKFIQQSDLWIRAEKINNSINYWTIQEFFIFLKHGEPRERSAAKASIV